MCLFVSAINIQTHTHMRLLSHFACALHGGGQWKEKNWKAYLP